MATESTRYAAINGAKVYYEVAGKGQPLVFVHAGIADHRMWDDQFPVFAKQYRVIRFDMRGYGNTEPVAGEYNNAEDLYGLLRFLNVERTSLVGCSMGGGTIMDFALDHPDMAAALVMVGSGPTGLELDVPESSKFQEAQEAEKNQDWERLIELAAQMWFDGEGRTADQVNGQARERVLTMIRRSVEHRRKGLGTQKPPQVFGAERLKELHLPILIIYGDKDVPYIMAAAQYMSDQIAGAQKVLMADTAHLPNMERPEQFNRIVLDFLGKLKQ